MAREARRQFLESVWVRTRVCAVRITLLRVRQTHAGVVGKYGVAPLKSDERPIALGRRRFTVLACEGGGPKRQAPGATA